MKDRRACSYCLKTWRANHVCPEMSEIEESMQALRAAMRNALNGRTVQNAASIATCSENTIQRILRGENVMFGTLARIATRLGAKLIIDIQP